MYSSLLSVTDISSFLLARFHVDSLLAKTTLAQIRKSLQDLPRGPDAYKQAYEKTIVRIRGQPSEHQQLAKRTLQWLACAVSEITVSELRHALAIRDDSSSLPNEEDLESTNFVIKVCMGLVIVERESDVIRLLHHTTLEYLQENMIYLWSLENLEAVEARLLPPKSSKYAMQQVHQDIAKVCINSLSVENIQLVLIKRDRDWDCDTRIPDEYPFLEYAIYNWARHWRKGFNEMSLPVSMIEIITNFLGNEILMADVMEIFYSHELYVDYPVREMTTLHFIAFFFGLTSMIDVCLNNGHDIHATTRRGENALWFALLGKHEDTSKALLQRGAREAFVLAHKTLRSSLGLAIHNGMGLAADLLRDDNFGAIINPKAKVCTLHKDRACSCYFTFPLLVAAEVGNLEMTKMLLERGAQPHAGNNSSGNGSADAKALMVAAQGGHQDVVECLLQADDGAVNVADERYRTPLYWAVREGHWSAANILLRYGGKLFGAGTDSDPGLSANVFLSNGRPSSIRFWGRDGMPVDISK
jgi:ankyrin repeat protein